jgi:hypothetical protein
MSLPEVLLILREDHRRESTKALLALQTEALAAFAVWDKDAGRKLEQFRRILGKSLEPQDSVSTDDLGSVFSGWGASVRRNR